MTIDLTEEQKIKILNADDIYSVMQEILLREEKIDQDREHFWIVSLSNSHRLLNIELIALGGVYANVVEPMNVFRVAVMKGAVSIMLIHNHPSGELKPSQADQDLTDRLIQVGRILNIGVLDHLIISTKSYLSFEDTGILAELRKSTKWVPTYELEERIREEQKKIWEEAIRIEKEKVKAEKERSRAERERILIQLDKAKIDKEKALVKGLQEGKKEGLREGHEQGWEDGRLEEKIAIARGMKQKGEPLDKIIDYTGLTRKEIEKIK